MILAPLKFTFRRDYAENHPLADLSLNPSSRFAPRRSQTTWDDVRYQAFARRSNGRLDRHVVAGRFFGGSSPLVVDLRRGHMAVPEELLNFANIHGRFE